MKAAHKKEKARNGNSEVDSVDIREPCVSCLALLFS